IVVMVVVHLLFCSSSDNFFVFFFFFQAEDGIRDYKVTGVQTCALPIYPLLDGRRLEAGTSVQGETLPPRRRSNANEETIADATRSEERRVGKECRYRWSAEH